MFYTRLMELELSMQLNPYLPKNNSRRKNKNEIYNLQSGSYVSTFSKKTFFITVAVRVGIGFCVYITICMCILTFLQDISKNM